MEKTVDRGKRTQKPIGNITIYETGDIDMLRILDEENKMFKRRVDTIWLEKNVLNP